ncbi:MAG: elongation factor Ts [Pedobacter sp.]|nr:MAG: elongation factor Ts [Pedobacter sp.]
MSISPDLIKRLREQTGAGILNCKNALVETGGDFEKAIDILRIKGLATAKKKNLRATQQGILTSYIHAGSKIGVLLELNCETDFVARRIEFQALAKELAMQVAAGDNLIYVRFEDIPESHWQKERDFESQQEDIQLKPQDIQDSIIQGRVEKTLRSLTLLDQQCIRYPEIRVEELIKNHIALLGENIQVRRFVKFILGENLPEK